MNPTPLNPDALKEAGRVLKNLVSCEEPEKRCDGCEHEAGMIVSAYLAAAQPVVNSAEAIPAKMRMLAWEGGDFEVGEIPEGHVLVGFEMATDRAWLMADKVTIRIERPEES
ncbi:hypothetical protein ACT3UQ_05200 [Glutamicibacter sp. AOP12-B1-11]|uniref:hypothetical protein n=1 Tax=Glutamicibacter sp. AOP12-B1-11 TaxID=3457725 RepID=UPI0040349823